MGLVHLSPWTQMYYSTILTTAPFNRVTYLPIQRHTSHVQVAVTLILPGEGLWRASYQHVYVYVYVE